MRFRTFAVLIVALAAGIGARAEIFEQILVKVNGDIFTKSDLEQRQVAILRQKGQQFDPKNDPKNEQLRKALDEITPQIMVDVVDEMLLAQRGKELGYRLSDEQFRSVVESIKKENKIETEEQLQTALKSENMTMADLRRNLEKSMIIQKVQQNEVTTKIGITEEEARAYYAAHQTEFTSIPAVTLREILIATTDGKGNVIASDDQAQARAQAIRMRVTTGGEAFDKLAGEMSDAASRANSGLIGPISLTDVSADLKKLLDAMKPGDVSPVIRTARGYQLLKLETMTTARTLPFDQAREQIGDRVFQEKRKVEFQKYLDKLRGQAIIEWKNPDVKRAFEEGLKQLQAPTAPQ
ncbi:MAG TPA: peptidyl-prolyl cis-trans isomerase [Vicinamibacterales bacterium]|nr:peptidyl-prolyl cis-trans isomerase [Vicinamibacterales bacterium]